MDKLKNFLKKTVSKTNDELIKMLEEGTYIAKNKYKEIEPLIKLTIMKCPPEIRTLLFQASHETYDWQKILKAVEDASWMAFPETENEVLYENFNSPQAFVIKKRIFKNTITTIKNPNSKKSNKVSKNIANFMIKEIIQRKNVGQLKDLGVKALN
ncbi:hypothetical protein GVAV_000079 [Gurleya vavrai]